MPQPLALTEADDGRTLRCRVGDRLLLSLFANPSTGYRWMPDGVLPAAFSLHELDYRDRSAAVGSGGDMRWTLQALQAGQATLVMRLCRPWQSDAPPLRRLAFTLVAQD